LQFERQRKEEENRRILQQRQREERQRKEEENRRMLRLERQRKEEENRRMLRFERQRKEEENRRMLQQRQRKEEENRRMLQQRQRKEEERQREEKFLTDKRINSIIVRGYMKLILQYLDDKEKTKTMPMNPPPTVTEFTNLLLRDQFKKEVKVLESYNWPYVYEEGDLYSDWSGVTYLYQKQQMLTILLHVMYAFLVTRNQVKGTVKEVHEKAEKISKPEKKTDWDKIRWQTYLKPMKDLTTGMKDIPMDGDEAEIAPVVGKQKKLKEIVGHMNALVKAIELNKSHKGGWVYYPQDYIKEHVLTPLTEFANIVNDSKFDKTKLLKVWPKNAGKMHIGWADLKLDRVRESIYDPTIQKAVISATRSQLKTKPPGLKDGYIVNSQKKQGQEVYPTNKLIHKMVAHLIFMYVTHQVVAANVENLPSPKDVEKKLNEIALTETNEYRVQRPPTIKKYRTYLVELGLDKIGVTGLSGELSVKSMLEISTILETVEF